MLNIVIETYFSNIPMLLCADGGYIAEGNAAARERLKHFSEEASLYDHMVAYDAMCFETAYNCVSDEILTFPLKGYYGFRYAAAVFQKLMGRRFAAVYLFQNQKECMTFREYCKNRKQVGRQTQEQISAFVTAITGIDSSRFSKPEEDGLFDLKAITICTLDDLVAACDFLDCDVTFTQNKEAEGMSCIPSAIGTDNYIKMLMCMVYVLNHLTTNRKIEVKLCNYSEETEVRMTTKAEKLPVGISDLDGLASSVPGCTAKLTLCQFIAGRCGGKLQARTMHDTGQISLVLTLTPNVPDDVDLKSRDQFAGYQRIFDNAVHWLRQIG